MKKNYFRIAAMLAVAGAMVSCNNAIETMNEPAALQRETSKTTRAYGDKTPKIVVYVETNDVISGHLFT